MKNTIEYWVDQASKGRNKAECWQAINKILITREIKNIDDKIEMLEKEKLSCSWVKACFIPKENLADREDNLDEWKKEIEKKIEKLESKKNNLKLEYGS